ncbi:MAG: carbohydrate binding domain-containing protein, partial [Candidatus Kapaibacterium sp.]
MRSKYGTDQSLLSAWGYGTPSGVNQFTDPGFEDLFTSPWQSQINTGNGAQAAYISSDADKVEGTRAAVFKILKGGRAASDVQLILTGLKCEKGKQYKFSIWMKSPEAGRKINVYLLRGSTPYTNYGLGTSVTLNAAWTEHSVSFTANSTDDNALLILQLGMYNSDVYLDKASLTEDAVPV